MKKQQEKKLKEMNKPSFLIWIPSLQKYVRFEHMLVGDVIFLNHSIDRDYEYAFALQELFSEKCRDKNIDIGSLTVLDVFVILLYLKLETTNELNITEKNGSPKTIQLVDWVTAITPLDQIFKQIIRVDDVGFEIDLPTLREFYSLKRSNLFLEIEPEETDIIFDDSFFNLYMLMIKKIQIKDSVFDMNDYSFPNRTQIFSQLQSGIISKLRTIMQNMFSVFESITLIPEYPDIKFSLHRIMNLSKLLFEMPMENLMGEVFAMLKNELVIDVYQLSVVEKNTLLDISEQFNKKNSKNKDKKTLSMGDPKTDSMFM